MEELKMITSTETDLRSQIKKGARTRSNWLLILVGVICAIAIFLIVLFTTHLKYNLVSKPVPRPSITRQEVVGPNNITLDLIQQKDAGWNDVITGFTQQEDAARDDVSQEVSQPENAGPNNNTPDVTQLEISGHNKVCLEVTQQEISGCNKVCLEVTQQVISGRNKICLEVTQPECAGENKGSQVAVQPEVAGQNNGNPEVAQEKNAGRNEVSQAVTRQDIFGNYAEPRVIVFLMSNETDEPLCYSAGSALLSGFPVVVAGYDMPFKGFLSKFDYMERAIENAGLKPDDVILVTDSNTLFMGTDIDSLLPYFQNYTAKTPEELNALGVRQGPTKAPFLVSSDASCNASDVFDSPLKCALGYEAAYNMSREYAKTHQRYNLSKVYDDCRNRHLNPGVVLARVWAYKEFLQKARNLTRTQKPSVNPKGWDNEQSVYTALYLDLIKWEVEHDVFSKPLEEQQAARSPYGLRAGLIGIDYLNRIIAASSSTQQSNFEMNNIRWWKYLRRGRFKLPHNQKITDFRNVSRFVSRLYQRAYRARGDKIFEKQLMPLGPYVRGSSIPVNITYAPLTFQGVIVREGSIWVISYFYPSIFHITDPFEGFTKRKFMKVVSIAARWFMPMVYNETAKDKAMQYLKSEPLFLSTNNAITRDSYHTRCGFPYKRVIQKVKHNTRS